MLKKYKLLISIFLFCLFMAQTPSAFALSRTEAESVLFGNWTNMSTGVSITITRDKIGSAPMTITRYDSMGDYSGLFHIRVEFKGETFYFVNMLDTKKNAMMSAECNEKWEATGARALYIRS